MNEKISSSDDGRDGEVPVTLSQDEVLKVLEQKERRKVIEFCSQKPNRAIGVDELIDHCQKTWDQSNREYIEIRLHHFHLPYLAERRIIEYDGRTKRLQYWPNSRLEEFLNAIQDANTV